MRQTSITQAILATSLTRRVALLSAISLALLVAIITLAGQLFWQLQTQFQTEAEAYASSTHPVNQLQREVLRLISVVERPSPNHSTLEFHQVLVESRFHAFDDLFFDPNFEKTLGEPFEVIRADWTRLQVDLNRFPKIPPTHCS